ncbi:MAG: pyridoxamine 5'-phosphate oxidase family protein [Solirubrobacterales bacterium]|nr:pyridoxamine 5'-phosphate oxidase family protein [Solirubrobacterales bacterium]
MTSAVQELSREECLGLLAENVVGRLAVSGKDTPVIRPVNYAFDEPSQSVVFRTAPGSKFYTLLRQNTAAFEVDGLDHGARSGWSVIVVGATEEVTNPADLRRLNGLDLEPWAPGDKPHWVRIRAWTVSGRRVEPGGQHRPIMP